MIYKWVGVSDEVTTCEACGKPDLKKTIALENKDGNISYFGCCCAAQVMGWSHAETKKRQDQEVRRLAREAKEQKKQILKQARSAYRNNPRIREVEQEICTYNRDMIPPGERPIKSWCDTEKEVKTLISLQYGVSVEQIF